MDLDVDVGGSDGVVVARDCDCGIYEQLFHHLQLSRDKYNAPIVTHLDMKADYRIKR